MKYFIFIVLSLVVSEAVAADSADKIARFSHIEPQYPSYIDSNHLGLCLRASSDLAAGTVVATADRFEGALAYIAGCPDEKHKYVGLMRVTKSGELVWGTIRGKWAFCNHSCDPTCALNKSGQVVTRRAVCKDEELTTAYDAYIPGFAWPSYWNFECLCLSPVCRKQITGYRTDIIDPTVSVER